MATVEERVSRIEGITEQINERLGSLEVGLRELRAETKDLRAETREEMRDLRAEMRSNFRWLMGTMMGVWVTIVAVVLGALLTR